MPPQQLGGGDLQVQANAVDGALLSDQPCSEIGPSGCESRPVTSPSLAVTHETGPIWGGVIVRRTDTTELVDNSLNERLAWPRGVLREYDIYHLQANLAHSAAG